MTCEPDVKPSPAFVLPGTYLYTLDERSNLYVMSCGPYAKVGIAKDVEKRHKGVQAHNPYRVRLERSWAVNGAVVVQAEAECHAALLSSHHHSEWFEISPAAAIDVCASVVMSARRAASRWRKLSDERLQALFLEHHKDNPKLPVWRTGAKRRWQYEPEALPEGKPVLEAFS